MDSVGPRGIQLPGLAAGLAATLLLTASRHNTVPARVLTLTGGVGGTVQWGGCGPQEHVCMCIVPPVCDMLRGAAAQFMPAHTRNCHAARVVAR